MIVRSQKFNKNNHCVSCIINVHNTLTSTCIINKGLMEKGSICFFIK